MDFKQYEYVLMVAQEKNFSKAAKKLFISQPSLSQYISRIESNLGVILFNRNASPLRLTYEGKLYVETAKKIMALSEEMFRAFDDVRELQEGRLKLGLTTYHANCLLPLILPVFLQHYPGVNISLTELSPPQLEARIISGEVDVSFLDLPLLTQNISFEPLIKEKIFMAAPPNTKNILADGLSGLSSNPFILPATGTALRQTIDAYFKAIGVEPTILLETNNPDTAIRLCAAGLGYAFAPEFAVQYTPCPRPPQYYPTENPPLFLTMGLAWKQDAYIPKTALAFTSVAKEVMKTIYKDFK